ncbi:MAG: tRNA (adenosine(37)-N6)-dimethylallyltransferase MiaA [Fimbriimonadaceae bacterium]
MESSPRLIAVMGPTGSGKSSIAETICDYLGAVLVSADAFQVYLGFDIGTNKPSETRRYEMVDICVPDEQFGLGEWIRRVIPVLERAWEDGSDVVVVGGTGLYIRALFEGYSEMSGPPDPAIREELMERELSEGIGALVAELVRLDVARSSRVDLNNPVRVRRALEKILGGTTEISVEIPNFLKLKYGLEVERDHHRQILEQRLEVMVERGWIEEVRNLNELGIAENAPAMRAIGYHTWTKHLSGATTFDEAKAEVLTLTVQYAKRQRTWMRKEPGLMVYDIDPTSVESQERVLATILSSISDLSGK